MKGLHVITILLCLSSTLFGQAPDWVAKNKSVSYDDCKDMGFCVDCGETKARLPGDINKYFEDNIDKKLFKKSGCKGFITIQVIIDTVGKACLKNVANIANSNSNNTEEQLRSLQIDRIIKNMPLWTVAISRGLKSNSSVMLQLSFLDNRRIKVDYLDMTPARW